MHSALQRRWDRPESDLSLKLARAGWQELSAEGQRAVLAAFEEAVRHGDRDVATEHLLLGMLREPEGPAATVLKQMGVAVEAVRDEIAEQGSPGDPAQYLDVQLTARAQRAEDMAYDEARQMRAEKVGPEHLLLGLLREADGLAGRVLAALGVDLARARAEVRKLSSSG